MEDLPGTFDFWSCYESGWEDDTHHALDLLLSHYAENEEPYPDFIDIGAWVGPISLWIADRCPKVIAMEPDPHARRLLKQNLKHNNADNVTVEKSAFGDGGFMNLGVKESGWFGDSMTSSVYGASGVMSITVMTLTLDQVIEKYGLDPRNLLLKMDIEGGEADALISNLDFIKTYRPSIHLSFHAPLFRNPVEYLEKMEYVFFELRETRAVPIDFSSLIL